jgi:hypothetical protein
MDRLRHPPSFLNPVMKLPRTAAAKVDFMIPLALAGVVFCTGRAWVLPLSKMWLPSFGDWLAALPASSALPLCGLIALVIVATLLFIITRLTRR